ncbi:MAG: DNA translocase FtsK 4TM domain-containing protein, partial [Alphaproteobacteria bacterium]|nr:DNA translocase FtsK 4TM domain-containing protein [Alphaproteobacteria bacterium]
MAVRYTLSASDYFSDELRTALRRRLSEIIGAGLLLIAGLCALALATWSVQDPSLSHATNAPVRNMLGLTGAIGADLMMQLFGIATIALLLPIAAWGWRLMTHRALTRERTRVVLWIVGALVAASFAACLPASKAWPLPTGLGGVVGDALLRAPAWVFGAPLSGATRFTIAILVGTATCVTLLMAAGFGLQAVEEEEEEEEAPRRKRAKAKKAEQEAVEAEDEAAEDQEAPERRSFVSLGWLYHFLFALRARLALLPAFLLGLIFRRGHRVVALHRDPSAVRLEEPHGEAYSNPADDQAAEMEEDEDEEDEDAEEDEAPKARAKAAPKLKINKKGGYDLPSLALLTAPKATDRLTLSDEAIEENARALESVLGDFGVRGNIIKAHPGPVVTLYELEPAPGIKSPRVIGLADDIARSMSKVSARVAVVAGRNAIGIELPNPKREKVLLREMLASGDYTDTQARLPLCLGKTIGGEPVIVDLARMPHLLIAGTTGSGKSVAINTMILSLMYRLRPDDCRVIMIDPKMLELSVYDGIPHLLTPVVTDPKKAVVALKWAVREMEERYRKMSKVGVRNIDGYNARVNEARNKGETLSRTVHTGYNKETGEAIYEKEDLELEPIPYIVVIVDEMADLMMVAGKDIEGAIQRLAQMARAAGIHVVLATQRPSVDVITGTIKANFPTRISFQVTSKIDSRTILGEQGAEQLLGQGDMLYMAGGGRISRVHGPFCSDEEVEKVVRHLKSQGTPQYLEAVTVSEEPEEGADGDPSVFDNSEMGKTNDLYSQAVAIVMRDRKASTSYIQRRLQIGYNRAASLMEKMELEGIVGQ